MTAVLGGAALLAVVHLFAGKLRFLQVIPRSRWLSFASGISVAYVFIHLLPELSEAQRPLQEAFGLSPNVVEHPAFVLAAAGLAAFYGLERLAMRSREPRHPQEGIGGTDAGVFWLHIGSFAVYNVLIGYALVEESGELRRYLLFLVAMALHFVVNDYGLREHHKESYRRAGRWVLAAAVVSGAAAGYLLRFPPVFVFFPLAFVAGGVILNVLKEELPQERESRFWAFALGMIVYGAILVAA